MAHRLARWLLLPACLSGVTLALAGAGADPALLAQGRRIYLEGIDVQGRPLQATLSRDQVLEGASAACVTCHRRSGLGGLEGRVLMPPITAPALAANGVFAVAQGLPTEQDKGWLAPRHQTRHAYTGETLQQALVSGLDPDGRAFADPMPRYLLDTPSQAALAAYLAQLGAAPVAQVGEAPTFWVVLTAGAHPERRRAVQQVLQAFAQALPPPAVPWQLRVLDLASQPDALQLALQDGSPLPLAVFGAGGSADWAPVQAACEAHALPCVLPSVPLLPQRSATESAGRYSVYLSEGLLLEARAVAQLVNEDPRPACRTPRVLVLGAGQATASLDAQAADLTGGAPHLEAGVYERSLQALLAALPHAEVVPQSGAVATLRTLPAGGDTQGCVVAWLPQQALRAALTDSQLPAVTVTGAGLTSKVAAATADAGPVWFVPQGLQPLFGLQLPAVWKPHLTLVSSLDAQAPLRLRSLFLPWTQREQLPPLDLRAAADAYAAAGLLQAALAAMEGERIRGMRVGPYSREELLETLEEVSAHARTAAVPQYSPLRIGGITRVAARTAVALRYAGPQAPEPTLQRRWVPQ